MKTTFMKLMPLFLLAALFSAISPPPVQAATACGAGVSGCARTTLSNALAAGAANNQVVVASATGISASTTSVNNATGTGGQQFCLIDKELVQVRSINSTTLTVNRANKGLAVGHVSGAQVICGQGGSWSPNTGNATGVFINGESAQPQGSCTRANQAFLPVFAINIIYGNGFTYDCLGGKWVQGTLPDAPDATPLILASNIPIGSVAYSSVGTQTAGSTSQGYLTSIMVPKTGYITGIKFLCGSTCTTDKAAAALRDSGGTVIAAASSAGLLLTGANTFQTQAFTAPIFVVGPARYFVEVEANGTTSADFATVPVNTFVDVVTGLLSDGTFGSFTATATMPTTFAQATGPVVELYY